MEYIELPEPCDCSRSHAVYKLHIKCPFGASCTDLSFLHKNNALINHGPALCADLDVLRFLAVAVYFLLISI